MDFFKLKKLWLLFFILSLLEAGVLTGNSFKDNYPAIGPLPELEYDRAKAELGKHLFFDDRLSGDAKMSCASCHDPKTGWGDNERLSKGYGSLYFRNSKTFLNSAHARYFYWDGRLSGTDRKTLARDSITDSFFMNMDGRLMFIRLQSVPEYVDMFQKAFGAEASFGGVLSALAEFQKSVVSKNVPFDKGELSEDARNGQELFLGKAGCIRCHNGSYFSDGLTHNTGVDENPRILKQPMRHINLRAFSKFMGIDGFENLKKDPGFYAVTKKKRDWGAFLTPTLRGLKYTTPYMHNGIFITLPQVIDFYNQGGGNSKAKDPLLKPLHLNKKEKHELISFLLSLSGEHPGMKRPKKYPYQTQTPWYNTSPKKRIEAPAARPVKFTGHPGLEPLGEVPIPPDNPMTPEKIELGKLLFFDGRLGGDTYNFCGQCHPSEQGWTQRRPISIGYPGTEHWRNSQSLINSAYMNKLFWDGSAPSLEHQAREAAKGAVSANGEEDIMEERLAQVPRYVKLFKEVFGTERPRMEDAWKAVAAFERTLVQKDTPYDRYLKGEESALTTKQKSGLKLFTGKARCIACHNGPLLSDEKYYNVGVPEYKVFAVNPLHQISFHYKQYSRGVSEDIFRNVRTDLGLYYTTRLKSDMGKFRTPRLRYLLYSAPYMHNGVFKTLKEVVYFFNRGGGHDPVLREVGFSTKSLLMKPLGLTEEEKEALVSFLKSTSGKKIIIKRPDRPPYAVMD
ncbi:cytochrome-c peroxidase [Candidatus Riflebacteria bacterium]